VVDGHAGLSGSARLGRAVSVCGTAVLHGKRTPRTAGVAVAPEAVTKTLIDLLIDVSKVSPSNVASHGFCPFNPFHDF
jgi:hypothetical protein